MGKDFKTNKSDEHKVYKLKEGVQFLKIPSEKTVLSIIMFTNMKVTSN